MYLVINDITLVIIGIAVMVILFASFFTAFIINQRKKLQYQANMRDIRELQQNQLIEAAVKSEETERHRIAEMLHDEVGAILSSSKLHLQGIKINSLDERDKKLFEQSGMLLNDGIQKVRSISHNLHSNILKEFGLNEAISHFLGKLTEGTIIKTDINLDEAYKTKYPERDISIYRMLQELINNILKHAHANDIHLTSELNEHSLEVRIIHNGEGLNQEEFETLSFKKEGLGLKNIQNRIILLKGAIEFKKNTENCVINIHIPS